MEGMNKRHLRVCFKPQPRRRSARGDLQARPAHALPASGIEFLRRMVPRNSPCGTHLSGHSLSHSGGARHALIGGSLAEIAIIAEIAGPEAKKATTPYPPHRCLVI